MTRFLLSHDLTAGLFVGVSNNHVAPPGPHLSLLTAQRVDDYPGGGAKNRLNEMPFWMELQNRSGQERLPESSVDGTRSNEMHGLPRRRAHCYRY